MRKMAGSKLGLLSITLLLLLPSVVSDDDDYNGPTAADTELLRLINEYRTSVANITALSENRGGACVAHELASRFKDIACTNETGADTRFGENPQIPDYPDILDDCDVSIDNVKAGYIAPNCVPPGAGPSVAAQNITLDQQYQTALNDTTYKSAGVGSSGSWYVLVLATDQPDGNFGTTEDIRESGGNHSAQMSFLTFSGVLFLSMFAFL